MQSLSAQPRTIIGKGSVPLKAEGRLPAVVYGPKQEALSISLDLLEFEAFLRHGGESTIVELAGLGKPVSVQVQALDRDPVTHIPRHVDFYAIEKGAKGTMTIPFTFVGEANEDVRVLMRKPRVKVIWIKGVEFCALCRGIFMPRLLI